MHLFSAIGEAVETIQPNSFFAEAKNLGKNAFGNSFFSLRGKKPGKNRAVG